MPNNIKIGDMNQPRIYGQGPYVKTHRRHFRQQSRYTVCGVFDNTNVGWKFSSHNYVFNNGMVDQDVLWKITIPTRERHKVLNLLDQFNINEFSLFGSDESLMETLAFREIDLKTSSL